MQGICLKMQVGQKDEAWGWREATLPVEIVRLILFSNRKSLPDIALRVVYRRVCRWWRSIVPPLTELRIEEQNQTEITKYSFLAISAQNGWINLMKWAQEEGCQLITTDTSICAKAAQGGQLETLKWLRKEVGAQWDEDVLQSAAASGDLATLKWVVENGVEAILTESGLGESKWFFPMMTASCAAAAQGHLHILEWLRDCEHGCRFKKDVEEEIETGKDFDIDQEEKDYDDDGPMKVGGYTAFVMTVERGVDFDVALSCAAAENGQIEVLRWAQKHGCKLDSYTVSTAVKGKQLETVKWLRSEGRCRWYTSRMCPLAAWAGSLELLKWVRQQGCPWNETTSAAAAEKGHTEILEWLIANGCPYKQT